MSFDFFGSSVAISGDVAVVGAYRDDDNGTDSGSAYVFRWNGTSWIQEFKLLPDNGANDDYFCYSVAITGDMALVGTRGDDDNGVDSGSAYVFNLGGPDCNDNDFPDECDIDSAFSQDCNTNGIPDECEEPGWVQATKFLSNDVPSIDLFGYSVAMSGDVAVVGALADNENGSYAGSAYVFRWNGMDWSQEQKLLPDDGEPNDLFGSSVSVSGDVVVVGAFQGDDNGPDSGSAYVFRWNGTSWMQEQKLLPNDGASLDEFGFSVSVSGDVALVGVSRDDDNGSNSGSAYVFRWNGTHWMPEQKLLPDDGAGDDFFGSSVSVSGHVALLGAHGDDAHGSMSGSAYVFRRIGTNWTQEQKLLPDDGASGDHFGASVSVSGDVAVVGANEDDDNGAFSGSAYVFRWNGAAWMQEQKLLPDDGAGGDTFGYAISVSGDVSVVGANRNDDNGSGSGSAYVFRWDGSSWVQEQKLLPDDGASGDWFGVSVSVSENVALVGAVFDIDNGTSSGSAYAFKMRGYDCNGNGIADECDIDGGVSQDADGNGVPDECEGHDAVRTLPGCYVAGEPMIVLISYDPPGGTSAVGLEDTPPAGWDVSGISDGGAWDADNGRVTWVFSDGDPRMVSYVATPSPDGLPVACFNGAINYDGGPIDPTQGDLCIGACGDLDTDGNIDLDDFASFPECETGQGSDAPPGCQLLDFDGDLDVDVLDFGGFQHAFTGSP